VIWPVLARYSIAVTAGCVFATGPTLSAAALAVLVGALVLHDLRIALRTILAAARQVRRS
jgi:hypothetical protein